MDYQDFRGERRSPFFFLQNKHETVKCAVIVILCLKLFIAFIDTIW